MSEAVNLFTQYSDLRAAKRAELEAAGASEAEIRDELSYIMPALVRPKRPVSHIPPSTEDEPDTRWDVPDADGAMPGQDEAEAVVMGRLASHYQAFHAQPEE